MKITDYYKLREIDIKNYIFDYPDSLLNIMILILKAKLDMKIKILIYKVIFIYYTGFKVSCSVKPLYNFFS